MPFVLLVAQEEIELGVAPLEAALQERDEQEPARREAVVLGVAGGEPPGVPALVQHDVRPPAFLRPQRLGRGDAVGDEPAEQRDVALVGEQIPRLVRRYCADFHTRH